MTEDLTILIEGFGRETESQMIHVSRCSFAWWEFGQKGHLIASPSELEFNVM